MRNKSQTKKITTDKTRQLRIREGEGHLDKTTLLVKLILDLAALANFHNAVEDCRGIRANLQIVPRMGGHTAVLLRDREKQSERN